MNKRITSRSGLNMIRRHKTMTQIDARLKSVTINYKLMQLTKRLIDFAYKKQKKWWMDELES